MPTYSSPRAGLPLLALVAIWLGMTAAWVAAAIATGNPCAWMGLVVVADVYLLLRLVGARRALWLAVAAAALAALTITSAYWMITATYLGAVFGLTPVESAQRLGPALAWAMTDIQISFADRVLLAAAVPLAAIAAWLAGKPAEVEAAA